MRHVRILGLCLIAALVLSAAAAGSASAEKVKKNFKIFQNCPVEYSETEGELCIYANTTPGTGYYKVGNFTVPLTKSVVLQFGDSVNEETGEETYQAPTHGAEAITPTPEKVPGEPIAHISEEEQNEMGWPEALKRKYKEAQKKRTVKTVYETIELAGTPHTNRSNLLNAEGTAVLAPVKVKGENKWLSQLGDVCYIGSEEEPIVQNLTSGRSESPLTHEVIEGSVGSLEFYAEFQAVAISNNTLVDNTYPVPAASCTGPYSSYIAATIDKVFGVPAVAGASETVLSGTLYNSTAGYAEGKYGNK